MICLKCMKQIRLIMSLCKMIRLFGSNCRVTSKLNIQPTNPAINLASKVPTLPTPTIWRTSQSAPAGTSSKSRAQHRKPRGRPTDNTWSLEGWKSVFFLRFINLKSEILPKSALSKFMHQPFGKKLGVVSKRPCKCSMQELDILTIKMSKNWRKMNITSVLVCFCLFHTTWCPFPKDESSLGFGCRTDFTWGNAWFRRRGPLRKNAWARV